VMMMIMMMMIMMVSGWPVLPCMTRTNPEARWGWDNGINGIAWEHSSSFNFCPGGPSEVASGGEEIGDRFTHPPVGRDCQFFFSLFFFVSFQGSLVSPVPQTVTCTHIHIHTQPSWQECMYDNQVGGTSIYGAGQSMGEFSGEFSDWTGGVCQDPYLFAVCF
jgi:hypothetical protein